MKAISLAVFLCLITIQTPVFASTGVDRECVRANIPRCLKHFNRPTCRRLLANACIKRPQWDRRCVRKHAPRCWHAMLTRPECVRKLRPICKK